MTIDIVGQGEGSADRRRDERVPARVEIRFSERDQAARALRAYSLNFSVGGVCLRTSRRYEVGATLRLSLTVEGETFHLFGAVAWVRDGAVGVRFENVTPNVRARLEALVASLRK
ncbi:MAG: PilZ domain-containing protein [Myxococcaceae bacterium]|nr:PilZ domain-containing protein [Myxococcaceae bacterium]